MSADVAVVECLRPAVSAAVSGVVRPPSGFCEPLRERSRGVNWLKRIDLTRELPALTWTTEQLADDAHVVIRAPLDAGRAVVDKRLSVTEDRAVLTPEQALHPLRRFAELDRNACGHVAEGGLIPVGLEGADDAINERLHQFRPDTCRRPGDLDVEEHSERFLRETCPAPDLGLCGVNRQPGASEPMGRRERPELDIVESSQAFASLPSGQGGAGREYTIVVLAGTVRHAGAVELEADTNAGGPREAGTSGVDAVEDQVLDIAVGRLWA